MILAVMLIVVLGILLAIPGYELIKEWNHDTIIP